MLLALLLSLAPLDGYLDRVESFGFSGTVLVAKKDEVLLARGLGLANREQRTPMTPETAFYVASLSKPITAAVAQQVLDVEAPLSRYLEGGPEDIRVRHLLTHRSGLGRLSPHVDDPPSTRESFVRALLAAPRRFTPGEKEEYSNEGYVLTAALIELATKKPFGIVLRETVLAPAKMTRTSLAIDPPPANEVAATAYHGDLEQGDPHLLHRRPYGFHEVGATGIVTTAGDLHRFVRWAASRDLLKLGWPASDASLLIHDGMLMPEGWNAQMRYYPAEELTVVVLANSGGSWMVARSVARLMLGIGPDVTKPRTFILGDSVITLADNHLTLRGQAAVDLLHPSANRNAQSAEMIRDLAAGRPPQPKMAETWGYLTKRFGALVDVAPIHSWDAGDDFVETYVRLTFANGTTVLRVIWQGEQLVGMSDAGIFFGKAQEAPVFPTRLPLVHLGGNRYLVHELERGGTLVFEIHEDRLVFRNRETAVARSASAASGSSRARP